MKRFLIIIAAVALIIGVLVPLGGTASANHTKCAHAGPSGGDEAIPGSGVYADDGSGTAGIETDQGYVEAYGSTGGASVQGRSYDVQDANFHTWVGDGGPNNGPGLWIRCTYQ